MLTLTARGTVDDSVPCSVATGRAVAKAGLHPATGGDRSLLCSGDMLLEALVACAGVTLRAVATALEVQVDAGTITADGVLDFRGTLGVDRTAPVGFSEIRLRFELDAPTADEEQLAALMKLTERYCVVLQTLRGSAQVTARTRSPRGVAHRKRPAAPSYFVVVALRTTTSPAVPKFAQRSTPARLAEPAALLNHRSR